MAKGTNLSCINLDDIHRSLDEPNFISNITLFIRIMPGQKNHTDKFQQKTRDKNYIVRWDHLGNASNKNNPNSVADKPFQDKRNFPRNFISIEEPSSRAHPRMENKLRRRKLLRKGLNAMKDLGLQFKWGLKSRCAPVKYIVA